MRRRERRFAILWSIAVAASAAAIAMGSVHAQDRCPVPPPIDQVEAQAIYSDRAGSRIDIAGLHRNQQLIQPLRSFTDALTGQVDDAGGAPTSAALRCATAMLQEWAAAGAMLQQPASFPAERERQRWALGMTLAGLKLRAFGGRLDSGVVGWLDALNTAVIQDFARRRLVDNLAVWSAANAASLALINRDRDALQYESRVWADGLRQIGPDGLLASELRRQSRALLYHQYYASALIFLRQLRIALGQKPKAGDEADLRRLIDRVETALCDPAEMASVSGGARQDQPPAEQFAAGLVFGGDLIDERWTRCGAEPRGLRDDTLGGRLDRTLAVLSHPGG
jgi:poly(beta-D-mannuronate) lyase